MSLDCAYRVIAWTQPDHHGMWLMVPAIHLLAAMLQCTLQHSSESLHALPNLMLQGLGFVLLADLNKGSTAIGFDRPMYVLQKPGGKQGLQAAAAAVAAAAQGTPSSGVAGGAAGVSQQRTGSASQHPQPSQRASHLSQRAAVTASASGRTGSTVSKGGSVRRRGKRAGRRHWKGSEGSGGGMGLDHVRQHTAEDLLLAGDDDMGLGEGMVGEEGLGEGEEGVAWCEDGSGGEEGAADEGANDMEQD